MNLADIRQKANRDRDASVERQDAPQTDAVEQPEAVDERSEVIVPVSIDMHTGDDNRLSGPVAAVAADAGHRVSGPDAFADVGAGAGTGHDHPFDPLAMLMAGRASSGYGDEYQESLDDFPEPEVADYLEFLCFRVCSERYAINIMEIREIIKPRDVTEVPRTPDFISGVLSLRGTIIPVFNMAKRLHLQPVDIASRERIIVVSKGEELFGIQVDEVLQVVRVPHGAIEPPPAVLEGIDRDFVQGIGRHADGMLILLNMACILDVSLC